MPNPAPSGYSGKPLAAKLGIKSGMNMLLWNAPPGYANCLLSDLDAEVNLHTDEKDTSVDFIQCFVSWRSELEQNFPKWKEQIVKNGMIWISWPKKAAKMPGDLDENIIRETGLAIGLVDVKVCAVDDRWSGLKFVYRLKDR